MAGPAFVDAVLHSVRTMSLYGAYHCVCLVIVRDSGLLFFYFFQYGPYSRFVRGLFI